MSYLEHKMSQNAFSFGRPNAEKIIVDEVIKLVDYKNLD